MRIMGIDPGKLGGLATLSLKSEGFFNIEYISMPLLANGEVDAVELLNKIDRFNPTHIFLEKVHSIFGSSAKSNFSFGKNVGITVTACLLSGISLQEVNPKEWQKHAWQGIKKVKDPKKNTLVAAQKLFPNETFLATSRSKVPHSGIVDACCIAYYGYLKLNSKIFDIKVKI
jgi:hypothetical protein